MDSVYFFLVSILNSPLFALLVLAGVYPLDNSFKSSSEANLNLLEGSAASMEAFELAAETAETSGRVWSIFAEEELAGGRVWWAADGSALFYGFKRLELYRTRTTGPLARGRNSKLDS